MNTVKVIEVSHNFYSLLNILKLFTIFFVSLEELDKKGGDTMKKWTSMLSMSAVALSLFAGGAVADANSTPPVNEERQQIFVAITDEQVTKEKLISNLKSVLP